jgi:glutamine cyclotransferase
MADDEPEAVPAEIVREYGPFPEAERINGVTYDGAQVWFAAGDRLHAFDPATGEQTRTLSTACDAGTAFDGEHFYQLAGGAIHKLDATSGRVLATIAAPGEQHSGLTWAEGTLWLGNYGGRKIVQIDAHSGAVLRTIDSNRFVTGVSWVEGELWHATLERDESELRRVDPEGGRVLQRLAMPKGAAISGVESDGADIFFCGGATSGKLRAVRRPTRKR